jgi:hypothetical protein
MNIQVPSNSFPVIEDSSPSQSTLEIDPAHETDEELPVMHRLKASIFILNK